MIHDARKSHESAYLSPVFCAGGAAEGSRWQARSAPPPVTRCVVLRCAPAGALDSRTPARVPSILRCASTGGCALRASHRLISDAPPAQPTRNLMNDPHQSARSLDSSALTGDRVSRAIPDPEVREALKRTWKTLRGASTGGCALRASHRLISDAPPAQPIRSRDDSH